MPNLLKSFAIALLFAAGPLAHAADQEPSDRVKSEAVARYTQAIVNRMDADKNGEVSKTEFMDFMGREFDRLDVNHDGRLMQKEILNQEFLPPGSGVPHR
jgi:hypothetical protein